MHTSCELLCSCDFLLAVTYIDVLNTKRMTCTVFWMHLDSGINDVEFKRLLQLEVCRDSYKREDTWSLLSVSIQTETACGMSLDKFIFV
jgi:hypothetical protein